MPGLWDWQPLKLQVPYATLNAEPTLQKMAAALLPKEFHKNFGAVNPVW